MKREKISRKHYDRDFILHAVKLVTEEGRKVLRGSQDIGTTPAHVVSVERSISEGSGKCISGEGLLKAGRVEDPRAAERAL